MVWLCCIAPSKLDALTSARPGRSRQESGRLSSCGSWCGSVECGGRPGFSAVVHRLVVAGKSAWREEQPRLRENLGKPLEGTKGEFGSLWRQQGRPQGFFRHISAPILREADRPEQVLLVVGQTGTTRTTNINRTPGNPRNNGHQPIDRKSSVSRADCFKALEETWDRVLALSERLAPPADGKEQDGSPPCRDPPQDQDTASVAGGRR